MKFAYYNRLCLSLMLTVLMFLLVVTSTNADNDVIDNVESNTNDETTTTTKPVVATKAEVTADDCKMICQQQLVPFMNGQAALHQEKETILQELNEMKLLRDNMNTELQQVRNELEKVNAALNDARTLHETKYEELKVQHTNEMEALQNSVKVTEEEMKHYQKVAQDNQKYMQEYKNQLHSQRDKANKLSIALEEATQKIQELESTTFWKQLQKEIRTALQAVQEYWTNLTNKGKSATDAEF